MGMQKSTQPQGLESLKKTSKIPQKSSKELAFDYDAVETEAEQEAKKPQYQAIVARLKGQL